jgi:NAD(P) transhydrogenase subunit alpha
MESSILIGIYIFVLAIFVGFELISKVPPTLHTPLMSGANAISGISLVGAIVAAGLDVDIRITTAIGFAAVIFATINVVGGYMVTDRMLEMFKKKKKSEKKS